MDRHTEHRTGKTESREQSDADALAHWAGLLLTSEEALRIQDLLANTVKRLEALRELPLGDSEPPSQFSA